ncbi:hypothetical protein Tco_1436456 [Tanacetum coccineum]
MGYSPSSDTLDKQPNLASVPKFSNINGTKTKTSSVDAEQSERTSPSREVGQSGESAMENEWIEQDMSDAANPHHAAPLPNYIPHDVYGGFTENPYAVVVAPAYGINPLF